ncbi:cap-specific mRNA (nucleoside-2'-O-)-methyltransferase 1-like [Gigantopelta aegis]|uniref:cap-specific mRNA (nucleoside-2'-O-)-methyltransferase 1-like n=1 Tax=Gigantopelta aegis TaxID=1735272 RepID=UPI001B88D0C4|nr:cap-specific mRNA (nucleoside-2'-O-)-methyltransferase 1-like [Gigantopelta aegis]
MDNPKTNNSDSDDETDSDKRSFDSGIYEGASAEDGRQTKLTSKVRTRLILGKRSYQPVDIGYNAKHGEEVYPTQPHVKYIKAEPGSVKQSTGTMEPPHIGFGGQAVSQIKCFKTEAGSVNTSLLHGKQAFKSVPPPDNGFNEKLEDQDEGDLMAPHAKYIKTNSDARPAEASSVVGRMMAKMGYKEGKGLGKFGQGRVQIVEASKHRGRRGLGMKLEGLEATDVEWNFAMEEVAVDEEVEWLPPCDLPVPSLEEMLTWKVIGPKKRTIDDEDKFCPSKLVKLILNSKNVFDQLEPEEMRRARTRSNPYETIRGVFFLNRAAMKLANIDAVLDFMFTNPRDSNGHPVVGNNDLLYFADICAGPGGFSEYVLWRTKGDSKGFGFTLKGNCDFKLEDFFAGPSEMFEPHYGVGGLEGDGDIFNRVNQEAFTKFVLDQTDGKGVHFVMADGGFSVEGQENIQEILSKQLYLCQFLVAMAILRDGGNFVCKLFDLFTPFSVGLVYLMHRAFHKITIFNPVTSRPANSERYIICKGKRSDSLPVLQYMRSINEDLCKLLVSTSTKDVNEIVPLQALQNDEQFFQYIKDSNEIIGRNQVINLKKIQVFTQNANLYEERQADIRKQCLEKWKVPDEFRKAPPRREPQKRFEHLIGTDAKDYFSHTPQLLTTETLHSIHSIYDYMCIVTGDSKRCYLLGLGKLNVFKWDGRQKSKWVKLDDNLHVELPTDTLLEVEVVQELRGEGRGQRRQKTIHVLDALFLCGKDVRMKHFKERREKLQKFVKAIRKPTRSDLTPVSLPEAIRLEHIEQVFQRLDMKVVKGSHMPRLCYETNEGNYFHPTGVYLIKTVKDPYMMAFSKSSQKKYWYHTINKTSTFECYQDVIASVRDGKLQSLQWVWEDGVKVHDSQSEGDPTKLSRDALLNFVSKRR